MITGDLFDSQDAALTYLFGNEDEEDEQTASQHPTYHKVLQLLHQYKLQ
jgi:hypothetical protein